SEPIGFLHVLHSSIYRVNALVFNSKAVVERRGFRPKIFDDSIVAGGIEYHQSLPPSDTKSCLKGIGEERRAGAARNNP
ncbi:MAG: hypothetical protein RLZZ580_3056, partial [Cyanobacteriota bacterium]